MGQQALYQFVSGPVLIIAAILLALRWLWGLGLHLRNITRKAASAPGQPPAGLFPLGKAAGTNPVFVILTYLLHLGLLILPFGIVEHSFSLFSLPTASIGPAAMAVVLLILITIIGAAVQKRAGGAGYIMALLGIITLVSGCAVFYSPDVPQGVFILHATSAVLLILAAVFSATVNFFDRRSCTGCAACHQNCPTGAIRMKETSDERIFTLDRAICARCSRCMAVCPENSVRLRHQFVFDSLFPGRPAVEVNRLEMAKCSRCNAMIAPLRQVANVQDATRMISASLCADCREQAVVDQIVSGDMGKAA